MSRLTPKRKRFGIVSALVALLVSVMTLGFAPGAPTVAVAATACTITVAGTPTTVGGVDITYSGDKVNAALVSGTTAGTSRIVRVLSGTTELGRVNLYLAADGTGTHSGSVTVTVAGNLTIEVLSGSGDPIGSATAVATQECAPTPYVPLAPTTTAKSGAPDSVNLNVDPTKATCTSGWTVSADPTVATFKAVCTVASGYSAQAGNGWTVVNGQLVFVYTDNSYAVPAPVVTNITLQKPGGVTVVDNGPDTVATAQAKAQGTGTVVGTTGLCAGATYQQDEKGQWYINICLTDLKSGFAPLEGNGWVSDGHQLVFRYYDQGGYAAPVQPPLVMADWKLGEPTFTVNADGTYTVHPVYTNPTSWTFQGVEYVNDISVGTVDITPGSAKAWTNTIKACSVVSMVIEGTDAFLFQDVKAPCPVVNPPADNGNGVATHPVWCNTQSGKLQQGEAKGNPNVVKVGEISTIGGKWDKDAAQAKFGAKCAALVIKPTPTPTQTATSSAPKPTVTAANTSTAKPSSTSGRGTSAKTGFEDEGVPFASFFIPGLAVAFAASLAGVRATRRQR